MLAPEDPLISSTASENSSNNILMNNRLSPRAPEDINYEVDDTSRACTVKASSPQFIEGYSIPPTHTVDSSSYRTPSIARHPQSQSVENSPSVNHYQLHSPLLSSNYIPPPSPTPSQHDAYLSDSVLSNQQHYQDPYQQTYQHTQAHIQPYPEPALHVYPDPTLVDTVGSIDHTSILEKPSNNGKRKKIIYAGAIIILILIGAIIGLVIFFKTSNDNNDGKSSAGNSNNNNSSTRTSTSSLTSTSLTPPKSTSSIPVLVPTSSIPVTIPTPTSGNPNVVTPKPLPPLPEAHNCPTFFCDDWYWDCRDNVCSQDGAFKQCLASCSGSSVSCDMDCRSKNPCQQECQSTWSSCRSHCRPA